MAWFHYQGHLDYDAALRELAIAEQGLPGDADLLFARSVIYTRMGTLDQALPRWERAVEQFELARAHLHDVLTRRPEDPRVMLTLAEALAGLEQPGAAISLGLQAIEAMPAVAGALDAAEFRKDAVIRVLARAGAVDAAVEHLDSYLAGPGFWSIEGLLADPRLDPLRDEPRFKKLVEKYRRR
jgi:tetratricopeptide (TPR) repeat protein